MLVSGIGGPNGIAFDISCEGIGANPAKSAVVGEQTRASMSVSTLKRDSSPIKPSTSLCIESKTKTPCYNLL